ncbi:MAG: hypothetical protein IKW01_01150 [Firmicutes bacterium]|nr:hypothetical protein [Bacillota bacterium]
MKKRVITNTEYLLRSVRDSEHLRGWKDEFSRLRGAIMKEVSMASHEREQENPETDNPMEM